MPRKYTEEEAIAKFWERVDKAGPIPPHAPELGPCWIWLAGTSYGYGTVRWRLENCKAHRVAYELANGPIPDDLLACHKCDNPRCVNPAHIFLGTHLDNSGDAVSKQRTARGDKSGRRRYPERWPSVKGAANGRAQLSNEQVRLIRQRRAAGVILREIAEEFGIGSGTVSHIVKGRTWTHVT